jgi:hypothetical protein
MAAFGGARAGEYAEHDHQRLLHEAADNHQLLHGISPRVLSGNWSAGTIADTDTQDLERAHPATSRYNPHGLMSGRDKCSAAT